MLIVSGSGCHFENLYLIYGRGSAANLIELQVTGQRNVFRRCHFAGPGNATEAGTANFNLIDINGSPGDGNHATENLFEDCVIGDTSLGITAAQYLLMLEYYAAHTIFRNCKFICNVSAAGGAGTVFAKAGTDPYNVGDFVDFTNCTFLNIGSTALTTALTYASTTHGLALFHNCVFAGVSGIVGGANAKVWLSQYTGTHPGLALEPDD
jgi:hypothetical protein